MNGHDWINGHCEHQPLVGPPTDGNGHEITYFVRTEPAFQAIQKIITDKAWLKSLKAYTKFRYGDIMSIALYIVTLDTLDC